MAEPTFPCPCCGYLMFGEGPGSDDICEICYWEDDIVQLRDPHFAGGANVLSLLESQRNFADFGAVEQRLRGNVRPPKPTEHRDPGWRPVDSAIDNFERSLHGGGWEAEWPQDRTVLYWWRPNYWRRNNKP